MNRNILIASLFILGLNSTPAQACSQGNSKSTAYIRRDNNRCEGTKPERVSGTFALVSLVIRNISRLDQNLTLTVRNSNRMAKIQQVRVSHPGTRYLLDKINLKPSSNPFDSIFTWSTHVIKAANIPTNELLALANTTSDVYLPVTLGNSNNNYEFGFKFPARYKVKLFEIRRNNQLVYSIPADRIYQLKGIREYKWNGKNSQGSNADSGFYELKIQADLEQRGQPPLPIQGNYKFEHNSNWLR